MASRSPGPGELLAGLSGLLLLLAMFLPWFGLNGRARVPGTDEVITVGRDNVTAWEAFSGIDVLLALVAVLAGAVLVVALVRTPPPELVLATAATAALAALLIVFRLIDMPDIAIEDAGDTTYEVGRRIGAFLGLLGTAGIAWGAGRLTPKPAAAKPRPAEPALRPSAPALVAEPAAPASALAAWTRAAIDAECQSSWRRYDRRLSTRYARYFQRHPELVGEQRTSARDLVSALPPGWAAPADAIPEKPWQRHHLSAKSSQMLGVGLLGVAATRDRSLAWLWDALAPLPPPADETPPFEFARAVDPKLLGERPRQTTFDLLVDDPAVVIGVETRWREHGVDACRCRGDGVGPLEGERCSRTIERREAYWEAATDVLGLGARELGAPCPISPVFDVVRHAAALCALARGKRPAALALVYDADNPYYAVSGEWPGWAALLADAIARGDELHFTAISWQELVPRLPLDEPTREWAADKHGLG